MDNDEQPRIEVTTPPWLGLGMGRTGSVFCIRGREAVVNARNGYVRVYHDGDCDVVPPFLVAEVAGSLAIEEDREQLRTFAESILEWLERVELRGSATIYPLRRS